ncbi:MAG: hypothetical protein ACLFRI_01120 [Candidatus Izemoplasmataceae bacterium]
MKKIFLFLSLFIFVGILSACNLESVNGMSYMVVDVNPSIEFIVDEDNEVESFNLLNEDAEIVMADIIADEIDFIGMDANEALEIFLDYALELGYIDVNATDNVILVTVVGEDEDTETSRKEDALKRAEDFMFKNRLGGIVSDSGLTMDEFIELSEEYGVSPGKLRIAMAAVAADDSLTLEEALELPVRDLMAIVRTEHRERVRTFRNERLEEKAGIANEMREEVKDRIIDHISEKANMTPDEIRARIEERRNGDFTGEVTDYQSRMQQRREAIKERMQENDESEDDSTTE